MAFVIFQVFCVKAVLEKWLAACIDSVPAEMRDSVHPKEGFEPRGEYYTILVVCCCWFSWLPVLIDSSVSERFSGLFFIVYSLKFQPPFPPPPPKFYYDEEGCTDILFFPLPCPYVPWMTLPYLDFQVILQFLSGKMVFLMHVLCFFDSEESILT